jgi:predicted kinase
VHDLDDPALAGLTRAARYDTLLGLAAANLRTGRPVALDATQPTPAQVQAVLAHLSR